MTDISCTCVVGEGAGRARGLFWALSSINVGNTVEVVVSVIDEKLASGGDVGH